MTARATRLVHESTPVVQCCMAVHEQDLSGLEACSDVHGWIICSGVQGIQCAYAYWIQARHPGQPLGGFDVSALIHDRQVTLEPAEDGGPERLRLTGRGLSAVVGVEVLEEHLQ